MEEKAKKLVPEQFHKWINVFGKKASERILMRKTCDHAIDLKKELTLRKGKVYPLFKEKEEMREFIQKQIRKGYIRLSKSPQTAPVSFVGKKDGKKRMVQNYWYLNEWMVKNNYLLPLILDIVENIGIKKVFMKLDLRWEYNNVRIKEGDEWKAAFTIPEVLQTQVLSVGQMDEPCIGLTQENLIGNYIQDSLPYILKSHGPC